MADKKNIIDGKGVAEKIRDEIKQEIIKLRDTKNVIPGLAVVLVGDRKDSTTYVNMKKKKQQKKLELNLHYAIYPLIFQRKSLLRML